MKIHILLLLAFFFTFTSSIAQPLSDAKADYIWKMGYDGCGGNINWQHMTFNINNTNSILATFDTASFTATCATVCDSVGNLVFYTNGVFVYNRTNLKMRLDTLNPGYFTRPHDCGINYNFNQAALILPQPNHPQIYYLFHERIVDPVGAYNPTHGELYYTVVDSRLRNGKGGVVSWRNLLTTDSLDHGKLNAVRHANGRDWWITCWHRSYTKYRRCLLDPSGVHDFGWQQIATFRSDWSYGQSFFSPDGTRFAATTFSVSHNNNRIDVMDFDRCTGLFSNRIQFFTPLLNTFSLGLSISPNSRYLYVSSPSDMLQYDLYAANIPNSCDTVAHWDGFIDSTVVNAYLPVLFWTHQLGADGKIYISSGNGTFYMGRIDNPDERGVACNVRQHSVHLPAFAFRTVPNFPNFRLGPVDGSVCDTLGFNAVGTAKPPPETIGVVKAVPNPTSGMVYFENMPPQARLVFYDVLGREVFCTENTPQVNMQRFPKGIYFCSIFGANNQLLQTLKLVKIE